MKRVSRTVLLLLLVFPVVASAQAPEVTSINPQSGPASGGTEVVILGSNFDTKVQCIVPCPPTVTFGDVTVTVREESRHRLAVITPAHAPGTVDVTVSVTGETPVVVKNGFTFIGGPQADYELVLLPVYIDGTIEGAHGTLWRTDLWIRNSGSETVQIAPWPCAPAEPCLPVIPTRYALAPNRSLHNLPPFFTPPAGNPSRLLYVSRPGSADVSFGLRFADVSRSALNAGAEVPVVRENETLRRDAQLLNVPMTDRARVMLRIYDVAYTTSQFRVTFHRQNETDEPPIHSVTLSPSTTESGDFRSKAAYVQFDVTELLQLDDRKWPQAVRIEVAPLTPGSRYWAFASITNNSTQLTTLVTPQ